MRRPALAFVFFLICRVAICQTQTPDKDSISVLNQVTVNAYEYGRSLLTVPAGVGVVTRKDLDRFSDASTVPGMNMVSGVRMEERSPGSYRIAVRGSSLRSPFGIRNVKFYWNDLPFTDPGGNTYFNLIDPASIGQLEIIKGPGSSLYGAGTGGVVLLKNAETKFNNQETNLSWLGGSYGLFKMTAGVQNHTEKSNASVQYAHQQSDGYRQQSAMRRDVLQAQGRYRISDKRIISANFLYSDLYYETPGGLTLSQYKQNPKQARPAGGPNPGAVSQRAAVYNTTLYAGVSQEFDINEKWSNRTGAYLTFTQFDNPTIRNYERRTEQSFGARSTSHYKSEYLNFTFGGEFQFGFSPIRTYSNKGGKVDTLQTDNEITSTTGLVFAQAEIILPAEFYLTLGGSLNFYDMNFKQFSAPVSNGDRNFKPVLSPRIALLKKINSNLSVYGSISQGFSPPTIAEVFPSAAVFNSSLKAERGTNYETGVRAALGKSISVEAIAYLFQLSDAITIRRNEDGGEYFVNAGGTTQKGMEFNFSFSPRLSEGNFISGLRLWTTATINRYSFSNYVKDTISYSGNKLTGVSPNIVVVGGDIVFSRNIYGNVTSSFTDRIPLDDANTAFANQYFLLGARVGYRPSIKKLSMDIFAGADNLLNQTYSLGNDLNAQGSRFYNAAAGRNYFFGLKFKFNNPVK
jgi:iron complex outermembrane receptor protein